MKVTELFEVQSQKSWRAEVRKKHGNDVVFWNDSVHNRAIAKKDGKIVGQMDLKTGTPTVFEAWVIKNKDGKEKRFKDANSPEAVAWKNSSSPKKPPKAAQYTKEWWEAKEDAGVELLPWSKIKGDEAAFDQIDAVVKDQFGDIETDWILLGTGERTRDGVPCAITKVHVSYVVRPEDDMGVDQETSDAQSIFVGRNPKNPKKIEFLGFTT
jgi:hypothetical protein